MVGGGHYLPEDDPGRLLGQSRERKLEKEEEEREGKGKQSERTNERTGRDAMKRPSERNERNGEGMDGGEEHPRTPFYTGSTPLPSLSHSA